MKIYKIEIENYRQYEGKISIDISTDPEKNFTIIQGDNGCGKSNFMNAIIWCLYGDEMFKSDKNKGRPIISESTYHNIDESKTISASVSVYLKNEDNDVVFVRKQSFRVINGNPKSIYESFDGFDISPKGWIKKTNPEFFIESNFIPKKLRGFFFFDGEKMDSYFEDTTEVKDNVERLAQIDSLNNVLSTLRDTKKQINSEITKLDPHIEFDYGNASELQNEINLAKQEIENKEKKIREFEEKVREIDEFLKNYSGSAISDLQKNRNKLEKDQIRTYEELQSTIANINSLITSTAPIVFSLNALNYASKTIENETKKGTLPPNIKDVFVKELLNNEECICGRSLHIGEKSRDVVEKLLDELMPSDISIDATTGKYVINKMIKKRDFRQKYKELLKDKNDKEKELKSIKEQLDEISHKLENIDVEDVKNKEGDRRHYSTLIFNYNRDIGAANQKIEDDGYNLKMINTELERIGMIDKKMNHLKNQLQFANELELQLQKIKNEIIDEVRKRMEGKTAECFFNMIWKKNEFSDVCIEDDGRHFHIAVKSEFGNDCLGDISSGERQVLALSFTIALYSISGFEVPIIIDTPLGRISKNTRGFVAKWLPEYLSDTQVIILPTDSEYTEEVRDKLIDYVGCEYKIKHNEETKSSSVIEYD